MITVTLQDMIEFVFSQPDDKKVNFSQTESDSSCGCIMVQYAKYKNIGFESVGFKHWWSEGVDVVVAGLEQDVYFDDFKAGDICTYEEIKRMLKEKFPEQTKEFTV
jgi:hypothetical protein